MTAVLAVLFALLSTGLIVYILIQNRKIRHLTRDTHNFLLSGKRIPVSTTDDSLGHLQMEIFDLQERVLQERIYTQAEAKSNTEFVSDISHQLKTPLTGLRLYCEMENIYAPSSHTENELELIEKMEKLIANVLKLEKLRSDTYEMKFANCNLTRLANEIRGELVPLFPQKTISVSGEAQLRVDSGWFGEALGNLVKNACEHTAADGWVQILLEQSDTSVNITVEDNGGGVSPEELPRLFDRFHRSKNAVPGSAGIGLSITKAIVEKHHGIITAQNGKEGLKITMCLPVVDANVNI